MRAAYRNDLKGSPSELAHGLKPLLPGSLIPAPEPSKYLQELLIKVNQKTTRPAVQTKINQPNPIIMEPPPNVTHVYTLQHKKQGLDPSYAGPFKIQKRLSRSTVRIEVGRYKDNSIRTEDRHWSDLKAIKLSDSVQLEERPKLGRPPKNKPKEITLPTPITSSAANTGPPPSQPFTGFRPEDIKPKLNLFPNQEINAISSIDFTKPPPPLQSWVASPDELDAINKSISTRQVGS